MLKSRIKLSLETLIKFGQIMTVSIDYLLCGDLSYSLKTPIAEILQSHSPNQRADAEKILALYARACTTS